MVSVQSFQLLRTITNSSLGGSRTNLCRAFQQNNLEKVHHSYVKITANVNQNRILRNISTSASLLKPGIAHARHRDNEPYQTLVRTEKNDGQLISAERVQKLAALFGIGNGKAKNIAKKHGKIAEAEVTVLKDRLENLMERGLSMRRIRDLPWLLGIDPDSLDAKLMRVMDSLGLNKECSYAFLNLDEEGLHIIKTDWARDKDKLRSFGRTKKHAWANRISYLSETLGISLAEAADMVSSAKLHTTPIERIHNHIIMLLEAGIQREDIVKDPWIFLLNNTIRFKQRLDLLHSHGLNPIKPWMLRADEGDFLEYVQKGVEEQALLKGHNDLKGFLGCVLSCTPEDVDNILRREPSLKSLRPKNIHDKIVFLQGLGYTTKDLIKSPRILTRCKNKLEKRYYEMNELGYRPRISELYMTQMDYTNFLKSFLAR